MKTKLILAATMILLSLSAFAQNLEDVKPGRFDQGKMWTFENPPTKYLEETYGINASQEWMDDVRKSALRFASWCSASFVSEKGLIMTNHHCSRSVVASVMEADENFDDEGFYAEKIGDERQVPDLFVDQLVMVADITEAVKSSEDEEAALEAIQAEYAEKEGWTGLELETRTFYSGGQYSLYGFKRYTDIRLVLYPELALGYYGGDPDNFTYPRYNLDFTFFRAYDENDQPLTPSNFFEFNPAGAVEDEAVFVVGNPGSTGRYLTMAQLNYQKEVTVPAILSLVENRMEILLKAAEQESDVYKKDSITNQAFGLSNSQKAYSGRLKGYNDPMLMARKANKEKQARSNVKFEGEDPWDQLEDNVGQLKEHYPEAIFISPNSLKGKVNQIIHKLYDYKVALDADNEEDAAKLQGEIETIVEGMDLPLERALFAAILDELKIHSRKSYINGLLAGKSGYEKAEEVLTSSLVINKTDKFFKLKANKLDQEPLMAFSNAMVPSYRESGAKMRAINAENGELQKKIANLQFQISGASTPPDATFSLRISDGIVKGYEYNGTVAPYQTTYFGLYDRHYSNGQKYPWNLPEKWKNPPLELLKAPMNFVSTTDIIGGNSGSPIINKNAEVVGLAFDGNIESLPGYFIYDDEYNRTVSVHAGGIVAALKYIYKAERLLPELNAE